jgi:adenylate cyclase
MPEEQDLVARLVGHHLRQDEIRRIVVQLSSEDQEAFTDRLARLLRRTAALAEVSRRLADTFTLDVLLDRMVELVSDFLDAERCTIFLHDKEAGELYTKAAVGMGREVRFPEHQGIAGSVLHTGRAVVIADAYADERFNPEIDRKTGFRTRNMLCAPIVRHSVESGDEIVGVAQVLNKRGHFDADDLALLEALTAQAAGAFVNAQLHEQINRARAEESRLLEVTAALATELQLAPLLRKIMETVCLILEAERATLFLHDAKSHELWALVDQDGRMVEIRFPEHLGIAGSVFTSGSTVNIPDAYADSRFNREFDIRTGFRTRSILCMPVVNRSGQRIAVTQVLNRRGGPFGPLDERRLHAFSSQAAVAMENAQLFEEVTRVKNYNEAILQSMTNAVVTLDAAGTIVKVNDAACRLLRHLPEEVVGQAARDFFTGPNAWVCDSLDALQKTGQAQLTMDADLQTDPAGEATPERRRAAASINLTAVPLGTREQDMGAMIVMEDITNEKRLKSTMARYMPKEIAEKLLQEGEGALGGKSQRATVLFTDIRSFTSISERIGAPETVRLLNEYFGLMVDVLMEKGGILDKYIGDAIMAVFGAPFATPDDADHAVQTAIGMLRALQGFNARRLEAGAEAVRMGVGINTDEVLSGNIGSLKRMDFTVIGDGVNLASRLEGANKHYGTEILVSELTVRQLRGDYRLREVDRIQVKGKSRPVAVYEVMDHLAGPGLDEMAAGFAQGVERYRSRDFAGARQSFERALRAVPADGPSRLYLERCDYFQVHPPPSDWEGVWVMKEK